MSMPPAPPATTQGTTSEASCGAPHQKLWWTEQFEKVVEALSERMATGLADVKGMTAWREL